MNTKQKDTPYPLYPIFLWGTSTGKGVIVFSQKSSRVREGGVWQSGYFYIREGLKIEGLN